MDFFQEVILDTRDGLKISSMLSEPKGQTPKAYVLLLHQFTGRKEDYDSFCLELSKNGLGSLALDFRGHGQSAKLNGRTYSTFSPQDFIDMTLDAQAGFSYLLDKAPGASKLVVGASIGANIALIFCSAEPRVAKTALLSPGGIYKGIAINDSAQLYGRRPILVAACSDDSYSSESSKTIAADALKAGANVTSWLIEGRGHGTGLLSKEGFSAELIRWLNARGI